MARQSLIKNKLKLRCRIIQAIRGFFFNGDYLEVETPVRIPAPAPEAQIDVPPSGNCFLQASPELCMKQLLAAGYPKIFQICKCFRQKERGQKHLPEFTMLEWYTKGTDYKTLMTQSKALISFIADQLNIGNYFKYQGQKIDISQSWPRMTVAKAFEKYASISLNQALSKNRFDEILAFEVEPRLGSPKPLFLYDYPAACGSLARLKHDNPEIAERFELYIAGIELCNGFSELINPVEQKRRFQEEMALREKNGKNLYPLPRRFLSSLTSMPEASGNALGIDRLVMLLCDAATIDEVVAFTPEDLQEPENL